MKTMFEIRAVKGHYEVYHEGKFICSADTYLEAEREIKNYILGDDINET